MKAVEVLMTMGCPQGCRVDVDEDAARRMNATACEPHGRPLLVVSVKVRPAGRSRSGSKPEPRVCPVHGNGDPCCRRQKAGTA